MKTKALILILIFTIGFSLNAIDWNISGAGARAAGMGGAFIGVADDATAITWNPGGLTQLYRPEVSVVGRFIAENYKYESTDYEIRAYGKSNINYELGGTADLSESEENLNQIRVGAEYLVVSDFAVIPFRFGYKTIPTLQANGEGPSGYGEYTDQVIGSGFAFGTGLIFERVAIDATGELTTVKEEWDNWPDFNESESGTNTKFKATLSCVFYF
ncbi:MAG: hypothetical protein HOK80_01170 [Candidatus Cloacimonetes bacterium]|nr:hypothetical protein [Candidatus Cloacimonadota bacterium]